MTHPNQQAFFRGGHESGFAPGADERIARSAHSGDRAKAGAIARAMRNPQAKVREAPLPEEFTGPAIERVAILLRYGNWEMAELTVRRIAAEWELWRVEKSALADQPIASRLATHINGLGLPTRTVEMLEARGIFTAGSLAESFPEKLIGTRRCGIDTVKKIAARLVAIGLLTSEAALSAVGKWELSTAASY